MSKTIEKPATEAVASSDLLARLSSRSQDAVDLWLDDWRSVVMAAALDSCEAMAAQHSEFGYRGLKVDLATCPLCHAKCWLASRGFICAPNKEIGK